MNYQTLLKNAPKQDSPAFIDYLRANNVVVWENPQWIVIENAKYHTKRKPWLTAFHKPKSRLHEWWQDIDIMWYEYGDWQWLKKSRGKQSVPGRFHIHITP